MSKSSVKGVMFRVNSPEESFVVQEGLLALGAYWPSGKTAPIPVPCRRGVNPWHIRCDVTGALSWGHSGPQVAGYLQLGVLSLPKTVREKVKIGDKEYYTDDLAEALKRINPI